MSWNLQVESAPLTLSDPSVAPSPDIYEFQLHRGDTWLQTVQSSNTVGTFINVDRNGSYQWQVRGHDRNYGWSEWSDPCTVNA